MEAESPMTAPLRRNLATADALVQLSNYNKKARDTAVLLAASTACTKPHLGRDGRHQGYVKDFTLYLLQR